MELTKRQRATLVERWIAIKLMWHHSTISMDALENDGRSQKKVQRQMVEAGYLEIIDDKPNITSKAYDEIEVSEPDMIGIWEKTRATGWNERRSDPLNVVRHDDLSEAELAFVLANPEGFKFFLVQQGDIQYNRQSKDQRGPFTLDEIGEAFKKMDAELGFSQYPLVMIGTDEQIKVADELLFQERVENLAKINLAWALQDQGIFAEGENEIPRKDSDKTASVIYSGASDGLFFNGYGNLGEDPEKWLENCGVSIEKCIARINELNRNLTLLRKMKAGIEALPEGLDQFVGTLRDKCAEHIRKEDAGEDPEADAA